METQNVGRRWPTQQWPAHIESRSDCRKPWRPRWCRCRQPGDSHGTEVTVSTNISRLASGGGIFSVGTVTLSRSVIDLNAADREGGGISNAGSLTLNESIVESNSVDLGGGIHNWWAGS